MASLTVLIGAPARAVPLSLTPTRSVWTINLERPLAAPPAFASERGFFPMRDDRLAAFDLLAGKLLWVVTERVDTAPAIGEDLIFINSPDRLSARRHSDGSIVWDLPLAESLAVPLVWDNGWLVAASATGSVTAMRASDGMPIWRRDLDVRLSALPSLAADRVYLGTEDGRLVALRIGTGVTVWERRIGGRANSVLALEDRVYAGSKDKFFYSIVADTGRIDWRWRTGGEVIGIPAFDERRLYVVSLDNILRALDRRTGSQQWKRALPLRPVGGPIVAADSLLVPGLTSDVRAYRIRDGSPAGALPVPGELVAPPHVVTPPAPATPLVVLIGRDLAKGATLAAVTRSIDPVISPIALLPNPVPAAPPAAR